MQTKNKGSLATRYRPQTFAQVAGQQTVTTIMSRAAAEANPAPAYLLSGTRGVGKTTIARIFAKALNCEKAPCAEPCNVCSQCRGIANGSHMDVTEIDGASNNSVDDARALRETIAYVPMEGKFKVIIIDEAHQLTKQAFNALLKTLEEPPARVVFVFATTEAQKFPVTILSRCQHFVLHHLTEDAIGAHLASVLSQEGAPFDEAALRLVARRAAGSVRDGLSLLDQVLALAAGETMTVEMTRNVLGLAGQEFFDGLFGALQQRDCGRIAELTRELLHRGVDIGFFVRELADHLRNFFLLRQGGAAILPHLLLPPDEAAFCQRISAGFSLAHLHAAWQLTLEAQRGVVHSAEPGTALELLLLNLALLPQLLPVSQVVAETSPGTGLGAGQAVQPIAAQPAPRPAPVAAAPVTPQAPPAAPIQAAAAKPAAAPAPAAGAPLPGPQVEAKPTPAPGSDVSAQAPSAPKEDKVSDPAHTPGKASDATAPPVEEPSLSASSSFPSAPSGQTPAASEGDKAPEPTVTSASAAAQGTAPTTSPAAVEAPPAPAAAPSAPAAPEPTDSGQSAATSEEGKAPPQETPSPPMDAAAAPAADASVKAGAPGETAGTSGTLAAPPSKRGRGRPRKDAAEGDAAGHPSDAGKGKTDARPQRRTVAVPLFGTVPTMSEPQKPPASAPPSESPSDPKVGAVPDAVPHSPQTTSLTTPPAEASSGTGSQADAPSGEAPAQEVPEGSAPEVPMPDEPAPGARSGAEPVAAAASVEATPAAPTAVDEEDSGDEDEFQDTMSPPPPPVPARGLSTAPGANIADEDMLAKMSASEVVRPTLEILHATIESVELQPYQMF
ncbi:MAG: DNA polymerase III subunit gamma/tau [Desulfovibrio sp.]|jgi:DNA polymerase-3 subunit gamma/tau|nr:DNA polymerase III subunit gamma/tau [Desulfovibrio sp.]